MYRVHWTRTAINQLAAIWNGAADRAAVTAASYRVDRALVLDPENQGEERPPSRRIMFDAPLAVVYRIDKVTNTVVVINCRAY